VKALAAARIHAGKECQRPGKHEQRNQKCPDHLRPLVLVRVYWGERRRAAPDSLLDEKATHDLPDRLGVFGTLTVTEVVAYGPTAIAEAARPAFGDAGFTVMAVAALLSTAEATNATLYASSNLTGMLAQFGLFPPSGRAPGWVRNQGCSSPPAWCSSSPTSSICSRPPRWEARSR
jgi:hypothetical protein